MVCPRCRSGLRAGPDRLLPFGICRSGYVHEAAARRLVHRLKYEGIEAAGFFLASEAMAHLVPSDALALVPVPRARWRAITYGIDPATSLAVHLSALIGIPVVACLRPGFVARRHAGRALDERVEPVFGLIDAPPAGAVLIDDVLTTGSTLAAAAATLGGGVAAAVTATVSV